MGATSVLQVYIMKFVILGHRCAVVGRSLAINIPGADSQNPMPLSRLIPTSIDLTNTINTYQIISNHINTTMANFMDSTSADKRLSAPEQSHDLCVALTSSHVQWSFGAWGPPLAPGEIDTSQKENHF